MYKVKPFDGITELLAALKDRGIKNAVFSNKPHAQAVEVIGDLFAPGTFDAVQGQMDSLRRKPFPDGALEIAGRLGVRPEECLYFGDTDTDMQTGTAAGMFTIGVLWGFRPKEELLEHGAMALICKPLDALELL